VRERRTVVERDRERERERNRERTREREIGRWRGTREREEVIERK